MSSNTQNMATGTAAGSTLLIPAKRPHEVERGPNQHHQQLDDYQPRNMLLETSKQEQPISLSPSSPLSSHMPSSPSSTTEATETAGSSENWLYTPVGSRQASSLLPVIYVPEGQKRPKYRSYGFQKPKHTSPLPWNKEVPEETKKSRHWPCIPVAQDTTPYPTAIAEAPEKREQYRHWPHIPIINHKYEPSLEAIAEVPKDQKQRSKHWPYGSIHGRAKKPSLSPIKEQPERQEQSKQCRDMTAENPKSQPSLQPVSDVPEKKKKKAKRQHSPYGHIVPPRHKPRPRQPTNEVITQEQEKSGPPASMPVIKVTEYTHETKQEDQKTTRSRRRPSLSRRGTSGLRRQPLMPTIVEVPEEEKEEIGFFTEEKQKENVKSKFHHPRPDGEMSWSTSKSTSSKPHPRSQARWPSTRSRYSKHHSTRGGTSRTPDGTRTSYAPVPFSPDSPILEPIAELRAEMTLAFRPRVRDTEEKENEKGNKKTEENGH